MNASVDAGAEAEEHAREAGLDHRAQSASNAFRRRATSR